MVWSRFFCIKINHCCRPWAGTRENDILPHFFFFHYKKSARKRRSWQFPRVGRIQCTATSWFLSRESLYPSVSASFKEIISMTGASWPKDEGTPFKWEETIIDQKINTSSGDTFLVLITVSYSFFLKMNKKIMIYRFNGRRQKARTNYWTIMKMPFFGLQWSDLRCQWLSKLSLKLSSTVENHRDIQKKIQSQFFVQCFCRPRTFKINHSSSIFIKWMVH